MSAKSFFTQPPFSEFPFKTFPQVLDKLEYLGRNEEQTPYEISPGTDLCISDTYYSLGFLTYLHAFGKVVEKDGIWSLESEGTSLPNKPYRYALIESAVEILQVLKNGAKTIEKIHESVSNLSKEEVTNYLRILLLISQKGKVEQREMGWDASYVLLDW
jgi:hypothetical protein